MSQAALPRLPDELQHIAQTIQRIEVIGEAARNVQRHHADFAAAQAHVPWAAMVGMRNRVSHGYFAVDWDLIWATVQQDLPTLCEQINALLIEQGATGA